jgi:CRP/FNR family cyclic AMP-dependent transcriptional regulator
VIACFLSCRTGSTANLLTAREIDSGGDEVRLIAADLANVSLFAGLGEDELLALTDAARARRLARGQILFSEGEPSDCLYLVRSGRLRVFLASPRGEELTLAVVTPGQTLGELSVLDQQPRSASVAAIEATELAAITGDDVRALLEANPGSLRAVALGLAAALRRLNGTAADLVFLDLPRRLAKLLLTESTSCADGAIQSELGMNQSGVAARLGVTRQSLNRALSGLAQRGWLTVEGTLVRLDDVAALRQFADT